MSLEGIGNLKGSNPEKEIDPFLEELWEEYSFLGNPPFVGSIAEKRLKEACDSYANFLESHKFSSSPKDDSEGSDYKIKKLEVGESERRKLHNLIALMVIGKQRSGMETKLAKKIASFAFEYSKGYKMEEEIEKD